MCADGIVARHRSCLLQNDSGKTMKILVYGINFAPELTGIGKYSGEMAAWLARQGHEVRVVTAQAYYPSWRVARNRYSNESWQGTRVWRCPLWVPRNPTGAKRVLHLLTFALTSAPVLLRQIFWRPDVVWMAAPAFACAPLTLVAAKLSGAKAWLHIQDFEIDVAFDMGLLRGKSLRRSVTGAERWLMRRFDAVSTISQRMLARLAEKGVDQSRIVHFTNWVDVDEVTPLPMPSSYRAKLGIPNDAVVALFSGTLGAKQGLSMLPRAARSLARTCPDLVVVICGDGVLKEELSEATAGLANVRMIDLQPREHLAQLLGMADIHLLTQDANVADLVMPSKLATMLSSGRPVVGTVHSGTEVATVVQQCGLIVPPADLEAFTAAIELLSHDVELRKELGQKARSFAETNLASLSVLARFMRQVEMLVGKGLIGTTPFGSAKP